MKGMCPRLLLNKVVTTGTIVVFFAPVVIYVYGYVLYNGIKSYSKHMTRS